MSEVKRRHILSVSGGKDSTALALYMKDKVKDMEYLFCDTGVELKETYEFLDKLEALLGRPIVRLNSGKTFDEWLSINAGFLPSPTSRWCTAKMKIEPFEKFVGNDICYSYIGIRADENREGYISSKPNVIAKFPFKEDGLGIKDIEAIVKNSGLGMPEYYKWRSRSGCYFCFFQQKREWVGLSERHPDLFAKAQSYERFDKRVGRAFTWLSGKTLGEMIKDAKNIKARWEVADKARKEKRKKMTLMGQFADNAETPPEEQSEGCLVCHL